MRISEATSWIGGEINKKASELNKLKSDKPEIGKKVMRDFYKGTADVMNTYASRLKPEISIYIDSFEKGANAFTSMIGLHRSDINELSKEENEENKGAIISLIAGLDNGNSGMNEFYDAITKLPRIEKELNRARTNVEDKLKDLLNKMDASRSIAIEMLKTFE